MLSSIQCRKQKYNLTRTILTLEYYVLLEMGFIEILHKLHMLTIIAPVNYRYLLFSVFVIALIVYLFMYVPI